MSLEMENATAVILPFEIEGEYDIPSLGTVKRKPLYSFVKRAFDIFASLLALLVLALPMIVIAIAVKASSRGKAVYRQERLGLNGKKFNILKFRTMYDDAESEGAQWSVGDDDPRITPVGRFLRKTRLDELPQLLCVLKGEMSLIGPRPEREIFYDAFERYIHGFHERLKVKPGISGLAQVRGGYDLRPEEKILYDVEYIRKRSVLLDLRIMLETVGVLFTCKGAK